MFEESLLESGDRFKSGRRKTTTLVSFVVQGLFLGILVLIPLYYTETLPKQQLLTFLVAPPPPPPPPPPAAATPAPKVMKAVPTNVVNGALRTPTKIPEKVEVIKEEAPPAVATSGVVGGVPGGVPGGQLGGVIGGIVSSVPVPPPKVETPQRVRLSQGVSQGMLLEKVTPAYPLLAKRAHIQGSVVLQAVISKNGTIENLRVVEGHPMLAPAAIAAVKQWKYKPYLLNGEPVEVETVISVNFTFTAGAGQS